MDTSPTSNETITVSSGSQKSLLNVNMTNVTKLTSTNFLMWSRQVHALLDGYDLAGYVDDSIIIPSPTVTTADVVTQNPAYLLWKRQDKLIYNALLGAITNSIQPLLSTAETAAEIWTILSSTYAKPSRGHLKQLKHQIKQWTKGTKSINEYFQGLTTRFDQLALLGKPMDHENQVECVLEGLPDDYKTVVDQIEGRDVAPSLTEIHEKLLNHEAKLQATSTVGSYGPISANAVSFKGQPRNNYQGQSRGNNRNNQTWQQQQFQQRPNQNSPRPYQSHDSTAPRGYQGRCQICGVHGHSARTCPQLPQYGSSSNFTPRAPTPWQPRANMAAATSSDNWLLDSVASHHLTSDLNNLSLHQLYNGGEEVTIANGSRLPISHTGSAFLPTQSHFLTLKNVLYVPNLYKNLISVYRLCNANQVSVEFFPVHFQVKDLRTGARLLQGRTKDELYEWPMSTKNTISLFASPTPKTASHTWNSRLGHPSPSVLKTIVSQFALPFSDSSNNHSSCSHYLINKSHKLPFYSNTISSTKPLQYIYSDVWSSPIVSVDNFKYYVILVDHYTRYSWLYPLKRKSDVRETFIAFKSLVENRFQQKIQTMYSDNGSEFIALRSFLTTHGITYLTSPPHTPEHNGVAERKHMHIVETGLTLLHQASMPKSYWTYAIAAAIYLINRLPAPLLQNESPYTKLFHQKPNYLKLCVFGSLCFSWLRPYANHKLHDRSAPCVFLGYSLTQSAYLCLDRTSDRIYTSRHIRFVKSEFPIAATPPQIPTSESQLESPTHSNSYTFVPVPTSSLIAAPPASPIPDPHHTRCKLANKARWIARGFTQKYGIDYAETFSPVVKSITIRVVLQLAVSCGWTIKQLDVNNAFLHGTLTEEVYVTQPPGFVDKDRPNHVCRLRKALYGLKQAPRAWYQELRGFLLQLGFQNSVADTSVFVYIKGTDLVYTLVYVDDIVITGSNTTLVARFINALANLFSLKDPADLHYFLGIEAIRTPKGFHLMQRKYILDLLVKTNMVDAKPFLTPLAPHPQLILHDGSPKLEKPSEYRMVVGSLQYLAFTRPDIAYAVNRLSQFMHSPSETHWQTAKRVLRYLAGTSSHGIYLRADTPLNLHAYSDADWAGDRDDYKGVSRSSTEAEYKAVANTASEIRWVCSLLTQLGVTLTHTHVIYCDNVGDTYLCANPVFHSRMKHLALDYHFIRELVQSGVLRVVHVSTDDQLADALTKALPRPRFVELSSKIGVFELPPS
ncbi:unnamed protein product [Microthlaspi erraticum]|uniref:Integrase catalytic domain-containing protein n=1 Tax=Microthlaspi erraticum TaxID=1685480 RepID=A0A6D2HPW7_9BRAS|nr:unnamed protein product [Microthlaspi erraticum]